MIPETTAQIESHRKKTAAGFSFRNGLEILIAALVGSIILKLFVVGAVYIPSHSMEGTLLEGDYILVNKLISGARAANRTPFTNADIPFLHLPSLRSVERGDVVVFEFPDPAGASNSPAYFVKRCAAVSGDEIWTQDGFLFVNGRKFSHDPLVHEREFPGRNFGPMRIPRAGDAIGLTEATASLLQDIIRKEGHQVSRDPLSRAMLIDGRKAQSYRTEKNYLFVIGDNISNSYDSRHWGLLQEENVVGEPMMVYWSTDPSASIRWERLGKFVH